MAARRREEIEQRLIEHEVRLSAARETAHRYVLAREARCDDRRLQDDRRWFRGELAAMLAAAQTEQELHDLGLSDDVVREARLGDTLLQAWTRFRPQHLAPPPAARER